MSTIETEQILSLIDRANNEGIKIVYKDNRIDLKISQSKGISSSLLKELKERKEELLLYFSQRERVKRISSFKENIHNSLNNKTNKIPLSFEQEQLWFIDNLQGSVQYHIPIVLRLKGTLDWDIIDSVFKDIITRHKILRTVIREEDGMGYQEVLNGNDWNVEYIEDDLFLDKEYLKSHIEKTINIPFDLSSEFGIRVELVKLLEYESVMIIVMHHIISDAWSQSILLDEFVELYQARSQQRKPILPEISIQYSDYALWQQEYMQGEVLNAKLKYWKEKLSGAAVLDLPTDYNRPSIQSNNGATIRVSINKRLAESLKTLSSEKNVTLYIMLLSVFRMLLFRYSGQENICIGTIMAGRTQREIEQLIGFFVNTLALQCNIQGTMQFEEFLSLVKDIVMEVYEHQDTPFERVLETLNVERDLSRTPLFQVMFGVQKITAPNDRFNIKEATIHLEEVAKNTSKFDLSFNILEYPEDLYIEVEYCTDLFKEDTIRKMIVHYQILLGSVTSEQDVMISDFEMLPWVERHELLEVFNHTGVDYPRDKTVVDLFADQVVKSPDAIALVYEDNLLSYGELNRRSNKLGHYLRERGVMENSLIGICIDRGFDMLIGILGILKSGGGYVPIDPEYPEDHISHIVMDTSISIVLCSGSCSNKLKAQKELSIVDLDDLVYNECSENGLEVSIDSDSSVVVMYTSDNIGTPMGVLVNHNSVVNLISYQLDKFNFSSDECVLQFSNYCFDDSVEQIFLALFSGSKLVLLPSNKMLEMPKVLDLLELERVTQLHASPSYLEQFSTPDLSRMRNLRRIVSGGDFSSLSLANQLGDTFDFYNEYGSIETTVTSIEYLYTEDSLLDTKLPIGTPIGNTTVYILDSQVGLQSKGIIGELYIGGDGLSAGYLNRPESTRHKFIKKPFVEGDLLYKTGDLCRWNVDGDLEFIGRADDQVSIRGYRIELGKIESILNGLSGVNQGIVLAREDTNGSNRLVGYVVLEGEFDKDELKLQLSEKLPGYMVPDIWVGIEEIPLTIDGKVDRRLLPDPDLDDLRIREYVAPRNKIEKKLAIIWQDLLGIEQIGIHDDFFVLGSHSLLAIRVVSMIRKELELEISVIDLFSYPTISGLSAHLGTQSPGLLIPSIERKDRPDKIPLSYAQERLWFIDKLQGSVQYHQPTVLRLEGRLDKNILEAAFKGLVSRHELLRTVIKEVDGVGCQYIQDVASWRMDYITNKTFDRNGDLQKYIEDLIAIPYNLSEESILRVHLIQLSVEVHILLVMTHHIGSDGWSVGVMIDEFVELYNAMEEDRETNLPDLPIQYADYALWQREYLKGDVLEEKLEYWKDTLSGVEPLELSTDFVHPVVQSTKGASTGIELESSLLSDLQTLCRDKDVTLFMLMLSVFKVLLYRYSGQGDICVGSPIAGRTQKELEGLIGFFVNTLALRSEFDGDTGFNDLLDQVKITTLGAYDHQDIPFEKIVDHLGVARDMSRSPLFQVMFILQNTPESQEGLSMGDITIVEESGSHLTSLFDLTLSVTENSEGLSVQVEYCTDLFKGDTIERLLIHYEELLRSVISTPQANVSNLDMLRIEEKQELIEVFNNTGVEYPRDKTVIDLFTEQVLESPDAIALVYEDNFLTYGALNKRSNQLGYYLREQGVVENSLVGICLERSLDMVISILGILKSGGAYVPIDPTYPIDRIAYVLNDTRVDVVLSKGLLAKDLCKDQKELLIIDLNDFIYINYLPTDFCESVLSSSIAYVLYTSGSTGMPKGTVINHQSLTNFLIGMKSGLEVKEKSSLLSVTTFSFDIFYLELYLPLLVGGKVILVSDSCRIDGYGLSSMLSIHLPDYMQATPSTWHLLKSIDWVNDEGVTILSGGEAISEDLRRYLVDQGSAEVWNMYGPTETTIWSTMGTLLSDNEITIGRPIINTSVYVLDESLQLLPIGIPGELYLGGDGLAKGYLNNIDLSFDSFIDDPFEQGKKIYKTGDLVKVLSDGSLIHLGRKDTQVKVLGHRIELREVESIIENHPSVIQSIVVVDTEKDLPHLINYYTFDHGTLEEISIGLYSDRISNWLSVHEEEYGKDQEVLNERLDFRLWVDSFSGLSILEKEMQLWLDDILVLISKGYSKRVLDIGCGNGLVYYGLVNQGIDYYIGTDFSETSLDKIRNYISRDLRAYPKTELVECSALEVSNLVISEVLDTVVMNSLIQYFPGERYLWDVINTSIDLLSEGGRIIIGDVRDYRLLGDLHRRLLYNNYSDTTTVRDFIQFVDRNVLQEEELCIAPIYFDRLKKESSSITHIDLLLKDGNYDNELILYRYNVVLHIGEDTSSALDPEWTSWDFLEDIQILKDTIVSQSKHMIALSNVPNPRMHREIHLRGGLIELYSETIGSLFSYVNETSEKSLLEVNSILELAKESGYHILRYVHSDPLKMNLLLSIEEVTSSVIIDYGFEEESSLTNIPLYEESLKVLERDIREYVSSKLPDYMCPSQYVNMITIPLTPNGKVDRNYLKNFSDRIRRRGSSIYVAPSNKTEEKLAKIWREVLRLEKVGIYDNFFELGGHSLLATQMISMIRNELNHKTLSVRDLFELTHIASISEYILSKPRHVLLESKNYKEIKI